MNKILQSFILTLTSSAACAAPLNVVVTQPPGGVNDISARIWAECVASELHRPIVVLNKPGANGVLAVNYIKSLPADGTNILAIGMSPMAIVPQLYEKPPYEPQKDFAGIALMGSSTMVLVVPKSLGVANLSELARKANSANDGLNLGSPGNGTPAHLLGVATMDTVKAKAAHIPYIGEAALVTALRGGQLDVAILTVGAAAAQSKGGKIIPLAVYSTERSALLPDVPTIEQAGGPAELVRRPWMAVVAKIGTPTNVIIDINKATNSCAQKPEYKRRFSELDFQTQISSPLGKVRTSS